MKTGIYFETEAEIVSRKVEAEDIVSCVLKAEKTADTFKPGQFITVQVTAKNLSVPVLRRPFAISSVDGDKIEFIFHVAGRGTDILKESIKNGRTLKILGPLGNGFDTGDLSKKKLLIAGGIGIAPIKSLLEYYDAKGKPAVLLWGNRTAGGFFDTDHYSSRSSKFVKATDDGSEGFSGNVVDALESGEVTSGSDLSEFDIFAVGPEPMMRAVSSYLDGMGLECQVSLETPMACGMGVCQGCAVQKKDGSGYLLVCKDGPVFFSSKVKL